MKTRFSSNAELCHVWASQSQSEGRANNLYFRGGDIYSYGEHYLAAKMFDRKKKGKRRFILVNANNYSTSTAKHLSLIRNALTNSYVYYASNPRDPKTAEPIYKERLEQAFLDAEKKRKVESRYDVDFSLENITRARIELDELRVEVLGKKPLKFDNTRFNKAAKRLTDLLDRYNSPEKQKEREKKRQEKQAELEKQLSERVQEFLSGGSIHYSLQSLPFDLLRIKDGQLQTSRHASVNLDEAKRLYSSLKSGANIEGARVGSYTVSKVQGDTVQVGCHTFTMTELERVLGE